MPKVGVFHFKSVVDVGKMWQKHATGPKFQRTILEADQWDYIVPTRRRKWDLLSKYIESELTIVQLLVHLKIKEEEEGRLNHFLFNFFFNFLWINILGCILCCTMSHIAYLTVESTVYYIVYKHMLVAYEFLWKNNWKKGQLGKVKLCIIW